MGKSCFGLLFVKFQSIFKLDTDSPTTSRFAKCALAFSVAFLVLSSFAPLYQYTEGYQVEGEIGILDFTDQ
jgi:hypothetical protein